MNEINDIALIFGLIMVEVTMIYLYVKIRNDDK